MKIDPHHDFGKRECPSCACEVPANSNHCPICHYPFPNLPPGRKTAVRITAALLLVAFALWLLRH